MLVNSAGMSVPGRFLDLKPEDFKVGLYRPSICSNKIC